MSVTSPVRRKKRAAEPQVAVPASGADREPERRADPGDRHDAAGLHRLERLQPAEMGRAGELHHRHAGAALLGGVPQQLRLHAPVRHPADDLLAVRGADADDDPQGTDVLPGRLFPAGHHRHGHPGADLAQHDLQPDHRRDRLAAAARHPDRQSAGQRRHVAAGRAVRRHVELVGLPHGHLLRRAASGRPLADRGGAGRRRIALADLLARAAAFDPPDRDVHAADEHHLVVSGIRLDLRADRGWARFLQRGAGDACLQDRLPVVRGRARVSLFAVDEPAWPGRDHHLPAPPGAARRPDMELHTGKLTRLLVYVLLGVAAFSGRRRSR